MERFDVNDAMGKRRFYGMRAVYDKVLFELVQNFAASVNMGVKLPCGSAMRRSWPCKPLRRNPDDRCQPSLTR